MEKRITRSTTKSGSLTQNSVSTPIAELSTKSQSKRKKSQSTKKFKSLSRNVKSLPKTSGETEMPPLKRVNSRKAICLVESVEEDNSDVEILEIPSTSGQSVSKCVKDSTFGISEKLNIFEDVQKSFNALEIPPLRKGNYEKANTSVKVIGNSDSETVEKHCKRSVPKCLNDADESGRSKKRNISAGSEADNILPSKRQKSIYKKSKKERNVWLDNKMQVVKNINEVTEKGSSVLNVPEINQEDILRNDQLLTSVKCADEKMNQKSTALSLNESSGMQNEISDVPLIFYDVDELSNAQSNVITDTGIESPIKSQNLEELVACTEKNEERRERDEDCIIINENTTNDVSILYSSPRNLEFPDIAISRKKSDGILNRNVAANVSDKISTLNNVSENFRNTDTNVTKLIETTNERAKLKGNSDDDDVVLVCDGRTDSCLKSNDKKKQFQENGISSEVISFKKNDDITPMNKIQNTKQISPGSVNLEAEMTASDISDIAAGSKRVNTDSIVLMDDSTGVPISNKKYSSINDEPSTSDEKNRNIVTSSKEVAWSSCETRTDDDPPLRFVNNDIIELSSEDEDAPKVIYNSSVATEDSGLPVSISKYSKEFRDVAACVDNGNILTDSDCMILEKDRPLCSFSSEILVEADKQISDPTKVGSELMDIVSVVKDFSDKSQIHLPQVNINCDTKPNEVSSVLNEKSDWETDSQTVSIEREENDVIFISQRETSTDTKMAEEINVTTNGSLTKSCNATDNGIGLLNKDLNGVKFDNDNLCEEAISSKEDCVLENIIDIAQSDNKEDTFTKDDISNLELNSRNDISLKCNQNNVFQLSNSDANIDSSEEIICNVLEKSSKTISISKSAENKAAHLGNLSISSINSLIQETGMAKEQNISNPLEESISEKDLAIESIEDISVCSPVNTDDDGIAENIELISSNVSISSDTTNIEVIIEDIVGNINEKNTSNCEASDVEKSDKNESDGTTFSDNYPLSNGTSNKVRNISNNCSRLSVELNENNASAFSSNPIDDITSKINLNISRVTEDVTMDDDYISDNVAEMDKTIDCSSKFVEIPNLNDAAKKSDVEIVIFSDKSEGKLGSGEKCDDLELENTVIKSVVLSGRETARDVCSTKLIEISTLEGSAEKLDSAIDSDTNLSHEEAIAALESSDSDAMTLENNTIRELVPDESRAITEIRKTTSELSKLIEVQLTVSEKPKDVISTIAVSNGVHDSSCKLSEMNDGLKSLNFASTAISLKDSDSNQNSHLPRQQQQSDSVFVSSGETSSNREHEFSNTSEIFPNSLEESRSPVTKCQIDTTSEGMVSRKLIETEIVIRKSLRSANANSSNKSRLTSSSPRSSSCSKTLVSKEEGSSKSPSTSFEFADSSSRNTSHLKPLNKRGSRNYRDSQMLDMNSSYLHVLNRICEDVQREMGTNKEENQIDWTVNVEVLFFYSMIGHKPVGVNRHFMMLLIHNKFSAYINHQISSKVLWDHLDSMYDMAALHESEIIPFPNEEVDYELPEDCHELLRTKYGVSLKKSNSENETSKNNTNSAKPSKKLTPKLKQSGTPVSTPKTNFASPVLSKPPKSQTTVKSETKSSNDSTPKVKQELGLSAKTSKIKRSSSPFTTKLTKSESGHATKEDSPDISSSKKSIKSERGSSPAVVKKPAKTDTNVPSNSSKKLKSESSVNGSKLVKAEAPDSSVKKIKEPKDKDSSSKKGKSTLPAEGTSKKMKVDMNGVKKKSETESNPKKKSETESNHKKKSETESNPKKKSETESNSKKKSETESNSKKKSETESNPKKSSESASVKPIKPEVKGSSQSNKGQEVETPPPSGSRKSSPVVKVKSSDSNKKVKRPKTEESSKKLTSTPKRRRL